MAGKRESGWQMREGACGRVLLITALILPRTAAWVTPPLLPGRFEGTSAALRPCGAEGGGHRRSSGPSVSMSLEPSLPALPNAARSPLFLKGQSQGCWLSAGTEDTARESFDEYCAYVERVIAFHGIRRVVWDGDPPEPHTFAERFPELFRRLHALRSPTDVREPLLDEIKAYRLKGCTQELQDMMSTAFAQRGLGGLDMSVRLLGQADSTEYRYNEAPYDLTKSGDGPRGGIRDPVRIAVEETTVADEGRNPYIALGWYSLTEGMPMHRVGAAGATEAQLQAERAAAPHKVVVCLGGGATCRLEFERACREQVNSTWCLPRAVLHARRRMRPPLPRPAARKRPRRALAGNHQRVCAHTHRTCTATQVLPVSATCHRCRPGHTKGQAVIHKLGTRSPGVLHAPLPQCSRDLHTLFLALRLSYATHSFLTVVGSCRRTARSLPTTGPLAVSFTTHRPRKDQCWESPNNVQRTDMSRAKPLQAAPFSFACIHICTSCAASVRAGRGPIRTGPYRSGSGLLQQGRANVMRSAAARLVSQVLAHADVGGRLPRANLAMYHGRRGNRNRHGCRC